MNYYLTGIEGMPKLLDCCEDPMIYFKKKTYPDAFKRMYQENFVTLDAVEKGFNMVIDKDTFLENMANKDSPFIYIYTLLNKFDVKHKNPLL